MRLAILALVLLGIGALGFYAVDRYLPLSGPTGATSDSTPPGGEEPLLEREVVALGRLEPAAGVISVAAVPGERLQTLHVEQGDEIAEEGVSLGVLASHELRQVELESLQAQLAAAKASHEASVQVAEAAVAQARAALLQAEGNQEKVALQKQEIALLGQRAELAQSDYDEMAKLAEEDAELVSRKQIQRQRLAWQTAQSEYEQAQQALEVTRKTSELAVQAAQADLQAAEANLEEARAATSLDTLASQVEAAVVQERWARLPAPTTGTVLKTFLRPGEFVTQTPILQMANLSDMVCIAEVFEADAKLIEVGDEGVISSSAFRSPFDESGIPGTVTRIGRLISAPGITDRDPLAPADRHVVEVVLAISPENDAATRQAAELVGLQVSVKFLTATSER